MAAPAGDLGPAFRLIEVDDLGGSVLIRPIRPSKDRHFQRRAMTASGKLDSGKLARLRFKYAVDLPASEVETAFELHGAAVHRVLDAVAQLSNFVRVTGADHLPYFHRRALDAAATVTRALRRRDHTRTRPRGRERRRSHPGRRRGSRRSFAPARGDPDDGDPEPPPVGPAPGLLLGLDPLQIAAAGQAVRAVRPGISGRRAV